jgi:HEAT repeat protein
LGKIGPEAKPAVPVLKKVMLSKDELSRTVAVWALLKIAPDPELVSTAIPLLVKALQSPRPQARAEAARTLGEIGAGSAAAKQGLSAALNDSDAEVVQAAKEALAKLK